MSENGIFYINIIEGSKKQVNFSIQMLFISAKIFFLKNVFTKRKLYYIILLKINESKQIYLNFKDD